MKYRVIAWTVVFILLLFSLPVDTVWADDRETVSGNDIVSEAESQKELSTDELPKCGEGKEADEHSTREEGEAADEPLESEAGEGLVESEAEMRVEDTAEEEDEQDTAITLSGAEMSFVDANGNVFAYELNGDNNATITGITVSGQVLIIPATVDGYSVTAVANGTSRVVRNPGTKILELTINQATVGVNAFAGCNIGTLTIGENVDIPEFNNLTYKDELELDKLGEEKIVLFLNISLADWTYSWITAMLFSIIFILLYRKGKERMETEGLTNPELKVPVRCLIDECRNIGKIPNLGEYLATCRKYQISIVPIFQNYSQIVEVYGKEGANSIIGNCDTAIFLGDSDTDTLKIICDRLGKETVKTLSFGQSKGKMSSVSTNKQDAARELMSRIQVEQMSNTECLVFIRALRPFKVKKYNLEEHPNYKYTAEADGRYLRKAEFCLEYNDEEIEAVRVKAVGEEGYIKPLIVDSARRRAQEVERKKKAVAEKAQEKANLQISDETKTKEQMVKELAEKENFSAQDQTEKLEKLKVGQMRILDSFDPMYEFE